MDAVRANRIATELNGKVVGDGWSVNGYLAHGKSALLVRAQRDASRAALKIFDPDIVERFGRPMQLERINRERQLIGKEHPHLVRILDGGECHNTGYLFVVMELLDTPNLASVLTAVPRASIWSIVSQVAAAAEYLEGLGLVHRDIKPDNIAIDTGFAKAILLDLGVLRPIAGSNLTDAEQKPFLGTLQYSSPEFLKRTEEDSITGWRALTFYQLGAVIHDLIMRRRLFEDRAEPYARLVEAVMHDDVTLDGGDVEPELVLLAKSCLLKDPQQRLRLVSWASFALPSARPESRAAAAIERIRRLQALAEVSGAGGTGTAEMDDQAGDRRRAVSEALRLLDRVMRSVLLGVEGVFRVPPMEMKERLPDEAAEEASLTVTLNSSRAHGLLVPLYIWLSVSSSDGSGKVLEVKVAAASAAEAPSDAEFDARAVRVAEGPLDERLLRERLREGVFPLLLRAMELQVGGSAATWLGFGEDLT